MRYLPKFLPLTLLSLTVACSSTDSELADLNIALISARGSYADLMFANYSDVVGLATSLQTAIDAFVATPDAGNLQAAKDAWNLARPYYQQSEVARFYDGPIDRPNGPETDINSSQLDEQYIDYVAGMANAGIINDAVAFPTIDAAVLRGLNGVGGATNVALGWHAIEFLLWGQDSNAGGPGTRPVDDYVVTANFDRRATYLGVIAAVLVEDLTAVRDEWAPNTGAYRAQILAASPGTAVANALTGMATLGVGELRGGRILPAFNSQDQEDEHSDFSDTTHLDLINNGVGVRNVWTGSYDAFDNAFDYDGYGMDDLFVAAGLTDGTAISDAITDAVAALQAQVTPFDQAILGLDTDAGRVALQVCLDRLNDFNVAILAGGTAIGLTVTSN